MAPKSNATIYELINNTRLELKADINSMGTALAESHGRLEKKFDELEAGRLTRAESAINNLKVANATQTTKLAVLGFIVSSIIGTVLSIVITRALK